MDVLTLLDELRAMKFERGLLVAEVERLTTENYYLAHDGQCDVMTAREELAKVTAERDALKLQVQGWIQGVTPNPQAGGNSEGI